MIDFSGQADGSAVPWLEEIGYIMALDAVELNPRFEQDQLVLSTNDKTAGIFGKWLGANNQLRGVERVRFEWGVSRFSGSHSWDYRITVCGIAFDQGLLPG